MHASLLDLSNRRGRVQVGVGDSVVTYSYELGARRYRRALEGCVQVTGPARVVVRAWAHYACRPHQEQPCGRRAPIGTSLPRFYASLGPFWVVLTTSFLSSLFSFLALFPCDSFRARRKVTNVCFCKIRALDSLFYLNVWR